MPISVHYLIKFHLRETNTGISKANISQKTKESSCASLLEIRGEAENQRGFLGCIECRRICADSGTGKLLRHRGIRHDRCAGILTTISVGDSATSIDRKRIYCRITELHTSNRCAFGCIIRLVMVEPVEIGSCVVAGSRTKLVYHLLNRLAIPRPVIRILRQIVRSCASPFILSLGSNVGIGVCECPSPL